jgi:hypothetical protein
MDGLQQAIRNEEEGYLAEMKRLDGEILRAESERDRDPRAFRVETNQELLVQAALIKKQREKDELAAIKADHRQCIK